MKSFLLLITFLSFVFFACDDTLTSTDIDKVIIPDSNVSYSQYIAPLFEVKCVTCHDGSSNSNQPNLSNFSFVDGYYVVPTEPDNSVLVYAIQGNIAGFPLMPPGGYRALNDNQVKGVRTWILEGANNN
jgi:Planctomycete cytochrome C